jgi:pimeloyl-ACP methyl ester carboxylesterase
MSSKHRKYFIALWLFTAILFTSASTQGRVQPHWHLIPQGRRCTATTLTSSIRFLHARKLPLVFWHGHGQSAKTWETTSDGREGFQNISLRRRFPVYLIDQPRRGRAARSTHPITITATPDEQLWFGIFRLGAWPNFYPGVQFSRDPEAKCRLTWVP